MTEQENYLFEEYTIDTPENVIFDYQIAGIGSRFVGALIDLLILAAISLGLFLMMVTVMSLVGASPTAVFSGQQDNASWAGGIILSVFLLLQFIIVWGYFIVYEIRWNGQTPGKRVAKTQVVMTTGAPVTVMAVIVRDLVRIIDWMPTAYFVGFIVMLFNDQSRRLGDYAAGAMVIKLVDENASPGYGGAGGFTAANFAIKRRIKALSLADINKLYETYPHIERLTPAEYELVEETTFGPQAATLDWSVRPRLAKLISPKLGGPLPQPEGSNIEATRILQEIVMLYNIHHEPASDGQDGEEKLAAGASL